MSAKQNYLVFLTGIAAFGALLFVFWPGYMSPDSITQLNQGLTGSYSDHHPPMMSLLWRVFSLVHVGPQSFLLFHFTLLFSAVLLLQSLVSRLWLRLIIVLLPLVPQISAYSGAIWKDVGFAFSFLLAAVIIAVSNIKQRRLGIGQTLLVLLLLSYGVGVKYQAQFVLPVMALWLGISFAGHKFNLRALFMAAAFFSVVFGGVNLLNKTLVPVEKQSHSWQYVKLYDLAGMSLNQDRNLFPDFVINRPWFSMEKVRKTYSPERVDELLHGWYESAPLSAGENAVERSVLLQTWKREVVANPWSYIRHRLAISANMLYKTPLKSHSELSSPDAMPAGVKLILDYGGAFAFSIVRELSRFYLLLPLMLFGMIWGYSLYRRGDEHALPLLMMNLSGFSLIAILFVFSMAGDLRYIYVSTCMTLFSIPIFIRWLVKWNSSHIARMN